ncbi:MAG TPA: nucleotidyl transferase AbiEii/AbiGii toxin family protein [Spirochaetales bacterium]|jgi:hypothetical protein|nr:nucleotidyl transferase AbiEii/AbiGii toxin family protein [Spirochaetales bacterium]
MRQAYRNQVALLVETLPLIARETCFALKGGTAINLFYRDMPRLSVDIDLAYVHFDDRATAISNIDAALSRLAKSLTSLGHTATVQGHAEKKIIVSNRGTSIKIEPNYTLRGWVFEPSVQGIALKAEAEFGYAEIAVVSKPELYGGKMCAALDRQHPRDLFDIAGLFASDAPVERLLDGFVAMLLCHNRPIHELLNPTPKDQTEVLKKEFEGMTDAPFTYTDHLAAFETLLKFLRSGVAPYRQLLLDFVSLKADLSRALIPNLDRLPAIGWKQENLRRLQSENPKKFEEQYEKLYNLLK